MLTDNLNGNWYAETGHIKEMPQTMDFSLKISAL